MGRRERVPVRYTARRRLPCSNAPWCKRGVSSAAGLEALLTLSTPPRPAARAGLEVSVNGHVPHLVPEPAHARKRLPASTRAQVVALLLMALILVTYLTPRLIALDRLVTVDESFWLGFSANFYEGVRNNDLARTYQYAHPGVTIMWAGTLGFLLTYPSYPEEHPTQVGKQYAIHEDLQALGRDALDLLLAGRVVKIVMQTVLFAIGFWLARPVFGTLSTVVA